MPVGVVSDTVALSTAVTVSSSLSLCVVVDIFLSVSVFSQTGNNFLLCQRILPVLPHGCTLLAPAGTAKEMCLLLLNKLP